MWARLLAALPPAMRRLTPTAHSLITPTCSFNRTAGQSNYGLQSPVPACHFWADHRYRILYVRNFKTAGTSITITLGQKELPMYCRRESGHCRRFAASGKEC